MAGQQSQVREIRIQVDTKGNQELKALASQMGLLNKSVSSLSGSFSFLRSAIGVSLFGFGVREIANISDEMQNLSSRLDLLSKNAGESSETMQKLLQTANNTKTSISDLATIYVRLAQATKESGISTTSLLKVTETLQNSFRLSGATTAEATNAAIQLSQGLASGQLRGQELRSVLEQNVIVGDILSKTLGKTRGELYKFAEQGKITSGVVLKALLTNAGQLNAQAAKLGQTFEQSVTVSLNRLKLAILEINKEFNVSGAFAKGLDTITEKFSLLVTTIATGATILAVTSIPSIISALSKLRVAFLAFAASNPLLLVLIALGTAIVVFVDDLSSLEKFVTRSFRAIKIAAFDFAQSFLFVSSNVLKNIGVFSSFTSVLDKNRESLVKSRDALKNLSADEARTALVDRKRLDDLKFSEDSAAKREVEKLNKKSNDTLDKKAVLLERLNREYLAGAISIESYFTQLDKVDRHENLRLFSEGKKDLGQYNEQIEKLDKSDLNRSLNRATISILDFNAAIKQNELEKLNGQLESGKISLLEYDQAFLKLSEDFTSKSVFRAGAENYIKSIGTVAEQTAGLIENTFKNLEDSFLEFIKTGKFSFKDFAQGVLDDLNRIIIRSLIIRPLAQGILNYTTGGVGTDAYSATQTGVNQKAFASGGVVNGPTSFSYGSGKLGLMGEAGPEAILPLRKSSDGSLGVQASTSPVYVNIVNQTDGSVEQRETVGADGERTIDILISNKVKAAIAGGQFDKTFQQAFGLRRRGA